MLAGRHVDLLPGRVIAPGREVDVHFEYVAAPIDRVQLQATLCCASSLKVDVRPRSPS
jgi:hypothetical protein